MAVLTVAVNLIRNFKQSVLRFCVEVSYIFM